jgi:competence protein ComGC
MVQTIYYRSWYLVDLMIVLMHILIVFVLMLPCFAIMFISKITYQPYSLYNEHDIMSL